MKGKSAPESVKKSPKKRAGKKKKIFRIMLTVIVLAAAALAVLAALFFGIFRVRNFSVRGNSPYASAEVAEASGISTGKNIFLADFAAAKENIDSSLPLADNIRISRKLPSTVIITLDTAQRTYALELASGTYAVTNDRLKVIEITGEAPDGTMEVKGFPAGAAVPGRELDYSTADGSADLKQVLADISEAVGQSEFESIEMINVENPDGIYLIYDGRMIIKLGKAEDVLKKLNLAKKSIDEENKLSSSQYGIMDVSTVGKASFRPKNYKDMPELAEYEESRQAAQESEEPAPEDETDDENDGYDEEDESYDYDDE